VVVLRGILIAVGMIAVGIATVVAGFAYEMLAAGSPYSDSTAVLKSVAEHHEHVARVIKLCGIVLIFTGIPVGASTVAWVRYNEWKRSKPHG
jgi:hypothetical protein